MAGAYATDHASALTDIGAAGAAMTFARSSPGVEAADGTFTPGTSSSIKGVGMFVASDSTEIAALQLTMHNVLTILFVPTTYPLRAHASAFVQPGDQVVVNATTYTVQALVRVLAPDGYVVLSRVVVTI